MFIECCNNFFTFVYKYYYYSYSKSKRKLSNRYNITFLALNTQDV